MFYNEQGVQMTIYRVAVTGLENSFLCAFKIPYLVVLSESETSPPIITYEALREAFHFADESYAKDIQLDKETGRPSLPSTFHEFITHYIAQHNRPEVNIPNNWIRYVEDHDLPYISLMNSSNEEYVGAYSSCEDLFKDMANGRLQRIHQIKITIAVYLNHTLAKTREELTKLAIDLEFYSGSVYLAWVFSQLLEIGFPITTKEAKDIFIKTSKLRYPSWTDHEHLNAYTKKIYVLCKDN